MKLYAEFTKVDADERIVSGYASTEAIDSQNEIVTRKAMEAALPDWLKFGNIREMHQPSAVGVAVNAEMREKGLFLEAHVVDDNAWKKVKRGVYKGFSIGGRVKGRDDANKAIITDLDLTEISLVDRPANPEALFDVWKVDGAEKAEDIAEPETKDEPQPASKPEDEQPANKGMYAVGLLAEVVEQVKCLTDHSKAEEAMEGDAASLVPDKLQAALALLADTLNAMAAEETAEISGNGQGAIMEVPVIALAETTGDVEKRNYTDAERKDMAAQGDSLPDGSFPIKNRADLENAIKALGRAKNRATAKAHIEKRAKELDATDLIPDGWADKADTSGDLEKKGSRNSAADQKRLNDAHDALVAMGAECGGSMKSDDGSDLNKVRDDLSSATVTLAETQSALVDITKSRDDATDSLLALTKAHDTVTTERDDLAKAYESLALEKASADADNARLKDELATLKSVPQPMKGKLLAIGKGDDVSPLATENTLGGAIAQSRAGEQGTWFRTRP